MKHKFSINTSSGSTNDGLFINSQNQSLYSVILSSFSLKFVKMPIPFSRGDHFLILSFLWHFSPPLVRLRRITWMLVPSGPIWRWQRVLRAVKSRFRCFFLINAASSVGVEYWMWRWWLPSTDISFFLYLHIFDGFHSVLLLGVGG